MSNLREKFKRKFGPVPRDYDGGSTSKLGNHWGMPLEYKLRDIDAIDVFLGMEPRSISCAPFLVYARME